MHNDNKNNVEYRGLPWIDIDDNGKTIAGFAPVNSNLEKKHEAIRQALQNPKVYRMWYNLAQGISFERWVVKVVNDYYRICVDLYI